MVTKKDKSKENTKTKKSSTSKSPSSTKKTSTTSPRTKKNTKSKATTRKTGAKKQPENQKSEDIWQKVAIGVVALVAVAVVVVVAIDSLGNGEGEPTEVGGEDNVVLTVNGEDIYSSEVDETQQMLMQQTGQELSLGEVSRQLVLEKILVQEAEDRGLTVTVEEVEEEFETLLAQQGMTLEELQADIESQGMDYQEFLEQQKDGLLFERLAQQLDIEEVTEEEAEAAFEQQSAMMGEEMVFEDVEDQIYQQLRQEREQQALLTLGEELYEDADIQVHDSEYEPQEPQPLEAEIDPEEIEGEIEGGEGQEIVIE